MKTEDQGEQGLMFVKYLSISLTDSLTSAKEAEYVGLARLRKCEQ